MVAFGLPVLAAAGLGGTLLIGMLLGTSSLAAKLAPWQVWLVWFVVSVVLMWFMMRRAHRQGGWRALAAGVGGSALVAAALWLIGNVMPSTDANPLAGVGWGIAAIAAAAYTVVGALVGLLVVALETGKRAREEMEDES
jgi:hypothetical protein